GPAPTPPAPVSRAREGTVPSGPVAPDRAPVGPVRRRALAPAPTRNDRSTPTAAPPRPPAGCEFPYRLRADGPGLCTKSACSFGVRPAWRGLGLTQGEGGSGGVGDGSVVDRGPGAGRNPGLRVDPGAHLSGAGRTRHGQDDAGSAFSLRGRG